MANVTPCLCGCGGVPKAGRYMLGHYAKWAQQQRPDPYRVDEATGCWIFTGNLSDQGYGWITRKTGGVTKRYKAHRYFYEKFVGPIPEGLTLDHLCHTRDSECPGGVECQHRRCVNPEHLEPVTLLENVARIANRKARCPHGHAYDEGNSYVYRGLRQCLACRNARNAVSNQRRSEQRRSA